MGRGRVRERGGCGKGEGAGEGRVRERGGCGRGEGAGEGRVQERGGCARGGGCGRGEGARGGGAGEGRVRERGGCGVWERGRVRVWASSQPLPGSDPGSWPIWQRTSYIPCVLIGDLL